VLEVKDLAIRFGGLQALQGLNLEVNEYEIVGLIGPNGAGKTTAFNCITGFYQPNTGSVTYRGRDVTKAPPHVKAAMGFGRTFQNVGMVKSSTALENLKTAQHAKAGYDVGSGPDRAASALRASASSRSAPRPSDPRPARAVPIRDVRVGRSVLRHAQAARARLRAGDRPDVLLLDEPTSGMGRTSRTSSGDGLLVLRREFALTMLVIEHHVPLVLRVCDHVYGLNFGRLLAEGKPASSRPTRRSSRPTSVGRRRRRSSRRRRPRRTPSSTASPSRPSCTTTTRASRPRGGRAGAGARPPRRAGPPAPGERPSAYAQEARAAQAARDHHDEDDA
jgi:branched-chain amino acid transport system ATP-binding protein